MAEASDNERRGGRRTPAEWAAEWVRKFGVYHTRRFGAGKPVEPEHTEDFLRFIATRWQAADWQQVQAREALEAWIGGQGAAEKGGVGDTARGPEDKSGAPIANGNPPVSQADALAPVCSPPVGLVGGPLPPKSVPR